MDICLYDKQKKYINNSINKTKQNKIVTTRNQIWKKKMQSGIYR